jgi:hypothetical protein
MKNGGLKGGLCFGPTPRCLVSFEIGRDPYQLERDLLQPRNLGGTSMDDRKTDMHDEYDFSGAGRGQHHRGYREGHTVRMLKIDGTVEMKQCTLAEDAVMLGITGCLHRITSSGGP